MSHIFRWIARTAKTDLENFHSISTVVQTNNEIRIRYQSCRFFCFLLVVRPANVQRGIFRIKICRLSWQLTKSPNCRIHTIVKIRTLQIAAKPKTKKNLCKFHLFLSISVALHVHRSKVDDNARSVSSDCGKTFPTKRKWSAASTIHETRQFLHLPKKSKLLIFAKKKTVTTRRKLCAIQFWARINRALAIVC